MTARGMTRAQALQELLYFKHDIAMGKKMPKYNRVMWGRLAESRLENLRTAFSLPSSVEREMRGQIRSLYRAD